MNRHQLHLTQNQEQVISSHDKYYFEDGSLVLQVASILFRVHWGVLRRFSDFFFDTVVLPNFNKGKGKTDDAPITIEDVTPDQLALFLSFFYPSHPDKLDVVTVEQWTSVLEIASTWRFTLLQEHCIASLGPLASPAQRVHLAKKHSISAWVTPAYLELCTQKAPLDRGDARMLGLEDVLSIWEVQHELAQRGSTGDDVGEEGRGDFVSVQQLVADKFEAVLEAVTRGVAELLSPPAVLQASPQTQGPVTPLACPIPVAASPETVVVQMTPSPKEPRKLVVASGPPSPVVYPTQPSPEDDFPAPPAEDVTLACPPTSTAMASDVILVQRAPSPEPWTNHRLSTPFVDVRAPEPVEASEPIIEIDWEEGAWPVQDQIPEPAVDPVYPAQPTTPAAPPSPGISWDEPRTPVYHSLELSPAPSSPKTPLRTPTPPRSSPPTSFSTTGATNGRVRSASLATTSYVGYYTRPSPASTTQPPAQSVQPKKEAKAASSQASILAPSASLATTSFGEVFRQMPLVAGTSQSPAPSAPPKKKKKPMGKPGKKMTKPSTTTNIMGGMPGRRE